MFLLIKQMSKYNFKKIEQKWQKKWQAEGIYEPHIKGKSTSRRKSFYNLMMFPYPSAEGLHVGNAYAFIGSDIYGRFRRMRGEDVFEPIGLDGFGIHSENYALKIGAHPAKQAQVSKKRFYKQLASLGNGFAWKESLETYDPAYYKWTQWIFIQLFKRGLAYRKKQPVNWCTSCKTVLADEQVLQRQRANGKEQMATAGVCERCDSKVIKKELEQWFFKITDYAEKLLKNIDGLNWSEKVKIAQRNWIGKSEGAEMKFEVRSSKRSDKKESLIIHGVSGNANENWFPWLKNVLAKKGWKVLLPNLPHADHPDVEEWNNKLKKIVSKSNNEFVVVGHSLGVPAALNLVQSLNKKVSKLILVAPVNPRQDWGKLKSAMPDLDWSAVKKFTDIKFNWKKISKLTNDIVFYYSDNDKYIPQASISFYKKNLPGAIFKLYSGAGHFNKPAGFTEFDELLGEMPDANIEVFTTRPDTLFGATYMVLAPEHELIANSKEQIANWKEVENYVKKTKAKSEEERITEGQVKTGVELKGIKAINPATGKEIPVWIADYVLAGYGTGAIMAVPAHDERDFEFAKKYKLPIKIVIEPETGKPLPKEEYRQSVAVIIENPKTNKFLTLNWGAKLGGTLFIGGGREKDEDEIKAALREIKEETGYTNLKFVAKTERMHHHYFAFSKNVPRNIEAIGLHFKLVNDKRIEPNLDEHEKGSFKIEWLDKEEILNRMEDENHILCFKRLVLGEIYVGGGKITGSGKFDGMDSEKAKWEITKFVSGRKKIQYRLRDWLISRQRYWGPPIPVVFCESCKKQAETSNLEPRTSNLFSKGEIENPGWIAVLENKLPVKLPFLKDFQPKGTGKSPLAMVKSFYETKCPKCGGRARRETDVSDTFLDSSWYFLRYPSVKMTNSKIQIPNKFQNPNSKTKTEIPWNREITKKWLPVDMYIGGAEHSVLHLLYSRFLTMFFHDCGLVDFDEPFTKFRAHGLLIKEGTKMSKSKGNVVNPDDYIKNFGADALRMYLMFLAPFEYGGDFRDAGIIGIKRFLERIWRFYTDANLRMNANDTNNKKIKQALHRTIKKVTEDIENLRYNTAISALMILLNEFEADARTVGKDDFKNFLKLISPFAPHISEEIFQRTLISADKSADKRRYISVIPRKSASSQRQSALNSIHLEKWPEYDEKLIKSQTFTLIIQVNGKVRDTIEAPTDIGKEEAEKLALGSKKIENIIKSASVKKVIYVPGRLVNIVI